jgi:hypothetical protein
MKKIVLIFVIVIIGLFMSYFSFFYFRSIEPDYGPATGKLCQGGVVVNDYPEYKKEIYYKQGFPIKKSGYDTTDTLCTDSQNYSISRNEKVRSWQFYANWIIYSGLLAGATLGIRKLRKH